MIKVSLKDIRGQNKKKNKIYPNYIHICVSYLIVRSYFVKLFLHFLKYYLFIVVRLGAILGTSQHIPTSMHSTLIIPRKKKNAQIQF